VVVLARHYETYRAFIQDLVEKGQRTGALRRDIPAGAGAWHMIHCALGFLMMQEVEGTHFPQKILTTSRMRLWGSLEERMNDPTDFTELSCGQKALWYLNQLETEQHRLSSGLCLRLTGHIDEKALASAFDDVGAAHPQLRSRFILREGQPSVVIDPFSAPLRVENGDVEDLSRFWKEIAGRRFNWGQTVHCAGFFFVAQMVHLTFFFVFITSRAIFGLQPSFTGAINGLRDSDLRRCSCHFERENGIPRIRISGTPLAGHAEWRRRMEVLARTFGRGEN